MTRDDPLDELSVSMLYGCTVPMGCTTCGGLWGLSRQLQSSEDSVPGHTEAMLVKAARSVSAIEMAPERVLLALHDLNGGARHRVLVAWMGIALSAPQDCVPILDWISRLRTVKVGAKLDGVLAATLPFLLATRLGVAVIDRFYASDPKNSRLAAVHRARIAITVTAQRAYPQPNASEDRLRAGLKSLPFMQRLHVIRAMSADVSDMLDDAITAAELQSVMLPEIQQSIEFLLKCRGTRPTIALEQLMQRRNRLQQAVRHDVNEAIDGLDPDSQLALILSQTSLPLAVVPPALATRSVVEALPQELQQELAKRAKATTMNWWRRHAKRPHTSASRVSWANREKPH